MRHIRSIFIVFLLSFVLVNSLYSQISRPRNCNANANITHVCGTANTGSIQLMYIVGCTLGCNCSDSFTWTEVSSGTIVSTGSSSLSNVPPGDYKVRIEHMENCGGQLEITACEQTFTIQNLSPDLSLTELAGAGCAANGGIIQLDINNYSNLTPPLTVTRERQSTGQITTSTLNSNQYTFTHLAAGTYTFTVADATGCSASSNITLGEALILKTNATLNADCGYIDINLNVSGGSGNYAYQWSNGATQEDLTHVAEGAYTATVTDLSSGCSSTISESLTASVFQVATINIVQPCKTNPDVTVYVSGGVANYTYELHFLTTGALVSSSTIPASFHTFSNLNVGGDYQIVVYDSRGCMTQSNVFNIDLEAGELDVTGTVTNNDACPGSGTPNGAIDLHVQNTGYPITYQWSNWATTQNINQLLTGVYTVTVTSGGCSAVKAYFVGDATLRGGISETSTCPIDGELSLSVSPSGGVAPYTYSWSTGGTGTSISNLSTGTYYVDITDDAGCTIRRYKTLNQNSVLSVAVTTTPEHCSHEDGTTDVAWNIPGATNTYLWSNGATDFRLSSLQSGTYTVTITSSTGCEIEETVVVPQSNNLTLEVDNVTAPSACGLSDGSVTINVALGINENINQAFPLSISWGGGLSNNPSSENSNFSFSRNDLAPGTYSVTVTDATGCTGTINFTIPGATLDVTSQLLSERCNSTDGGIEISAVNGSTGGNYTLKVNGNTVASNIQVPYTYQALAGGQNYTFELIDGSSGCAWNSGSVFIPQTNSNPLVTSMQTTDETCHTPGTATLSPSSYNYYWSNGAQGAYIPNLPAGTYQVTVSGTSCTSESVVQVNIGGGSAPQLEQGAINCIVDNNEVRIDIVGGVGSYSVSSITPSISTSVVGNELILSAPSTNTTYEVEITDANGCSRTESVFIGDNFTNSNASLSFSDPGLNCGEGRATVSLDNHPQPISSFSWTEGGSIMGQTINGIFYPFVGNNVPTQPNTNYTLLVEDASGCKAEITGTSPNFTSLSLSLSDDDDCAVTATITGGTAPYTLVFMKNVFIAGIQTGTRMEAEIETSSSVNVLNEISEGSYTVYVTDANGCTFSTAFSVLAPSNPSARTLTFYKRWKRPEQAAECTDCEDLNPPNATVVEAQGIADNLYAQAIQQVEALEESLGNSVEGYLQNNTDDETKLQRTLRHHHYTLYYHNVRGELVRTVPPEGVDLITGTNVDDIKEYRKSGGTAPASLLPDHYLVTEYDYNALGAMVRSETVDKGETKMAYDAEGRLRFSQDAQQVLDNTYSYVLYDNQDRTIEAGEAVLNTGTSSPPADWAALIGTTTYLGNYSYPDNNSGIVKMEWVKTHYDTPHDIDPVTAGVQAAYYCNNTNQTQRYLRNRVSYTESFTQGMTTEADRVMTTYSYDAHGNVEWIRQYIPGLGDNYVAMDYDLISGKVLKVKYNECATDRFYHKYAYNEQNRLTDVWTSSDDLIWEHESNYEYYDHGPLKRMEIGEDKVQGLDYTLTLQGWIKAVNHPYLNQYRTSVNTQNADNDPGQDGVGSSAFASDVFGYALGYFAGDYTRSNTMSNAIIYSSGRELYNGNIAEWAQGLNTNILATTPSWNKEQLTQRSFNYDDLNRIKLSKLATVNMTFQSIPMLQKGAEYETSYSYDANGNIESLDRYGESSVGLMDDLTYTYNTSNNRKINNKLVSVSDPINKNLGDLHDSQNYFYDAIGNLTRSIQSGSVPETLDVVWNEQGKVDRVAVNENGAFREIKYLYDASGNRVAKMFIEDTNDATTAEYTYHVRDASGNILATYRRAFDSGSDDKVTLSERGLYGSDRMGISRPNLEVGTLANNGSLYQSTGNPLSISNRSLSIGADDLYHRSLNEREYQLTDHLGNVAAIVGDNKTFAGSTLSASLTTYRNYYPFGWEMPGRGLTGGNEYRFGFNGKENDKDWGTQLIQDYGFRLYNPAIGKFLSVDPLAPDYPWYTPYQFAGDMPTIAIDLDGLEPVVVNGELIGYNVKADQGPTQIAELINSPIMQTIYGYTLPRKIEWTEIVTHPYNNIYFSEKLRSELNKNDLTYEHLNMNPGDFVAIDGFNSYSFDPEIQPVEPSSVPEEPIAFTGSSKGHMAGGGAGVGAGVETHLMNIPSESPFWEGGNRFYIASSGGGGGTLPGAAATTSLFGDYTIYYSGEPSLTKVFSTKSYSYTIGLGFIIGGRYVRAGAFNGSFSINEYHLGVMTRGPDVSGGSSEGGYYNSIIKALNPIDSLQRAQFMLQWAHENGLDHPEAREYLKRNGYDNIIRNITNGEE